MKKNLLVVILVFAFILGCVELAQSGVEPSPFCVRIVKLENVAISLASSSQMLELLLSYDRIKPKDQGDICHPPDPGIDCHPPEPGSPVSDGCVITINALAMEIRGLAKDVQRLEEAVFDVTKHPPEPGVPVDDITSRKLATIRVLAIALLAQIDSTPPPDDNSPPPDDSKVENALGKLKRNTQSIINAIDAFSPPPGADL